MTASRVGVWLGGVTGTSLPGGVRSQTGNRGGPIHHSPTPLRLTGKSRKEHELDQQAEDDRTVPELEQLHVGFQLRFDPTDLGRQARVKVRNFGSYLSELGRQARVEVRDLGTG